MLIVYSRNTALDTVWCFIPGMGTKRWQVNPRISLSPFGQRNRWGVGVHRFERWISHGSSENAADAFREVIPDPQRRLGCTSTPVLAEARRRRSAVHRRGGRSGRE